MNSHDSRSFRVQVTENSTVENLISLIQTDYSGLYPADPPLSNFVLQQSCDDALFDLPKRLIVSEVLAPKEIVMVRTLGSQGLHTTGTPASAFSEVMTPKKRKRVNKKKDLDSSTLHVTTVSTSTTAEDSTLSRKAKKKKKKELLAMQQKAAEEPNTMTEDTVMEFCYVAKKDSAKKKTRPVPETSSSSSVPELVNTDAMVPPTSVEAIATVTAPVESAKKSKKKSKKSTPVPAPAEALSEQVQTPVAATAAIEETNDVVVGDLPQPKKTTKKQKQPALPTEEAMNDGSKPKQATPKPKKVAAKRKQKQPAMTEEEMQTYTDALEEAEKQLEVNPVGHDNDITTSSTEKDAMMISSKKDLLDSVDLEYYRTSTSMTVQEIYACVEAFSNEVPEESTKKSKTKTKSAAATEEMISDASETLEETLVEKKRRKNRENYLKRRRKQADLAALEADKQGESTQSEDPFAFETSSAAPEKEANREEEEEESVLTSDTAEESEEEDLPDPVVSAPKKKKTPDQPKSKSSEEPEHEDGASSPVYDNSSSSEEEEVSKPTQPKSLPPMPTTKDKEEESNSSCSSSDDDSSDEEENYSQSVLQSLLGSSSATTQNKAKSLPRKKPVASSSVKPFASMSKSNSMFQ